MEKSKLERFINKYNLGGSCESVIFKSDGDVLSVRTISDDKNVLAEVSAAGIKFPEGNFPIYDTKKFRSMLGVLEEGLNIKTNTMNEKVTGLNIFDGQTKATFVLADENVIPKVPDLTKIPPMDVTIKLDEKFINTFVKAKGALVDVETFAIMSDGESEDISIVIGYAATNNTNRIQITTKGDKPVKFDAISFSANYLKEILVANKDAANGTLKISSKGLCIASFDVDKYKSTYYLVQIVI